LCCGEGIFPGLCLSPRATQVDALDIDPLAVDAARRRYRRPNLRFARADIVATPFPDTGYDLVSCFVSMQYFDRAELAILTEKIAASLATGGVFVGSVPLLPPGRDDAHSKTIYRTVDDLLGVLRP